MAFIDPFSLVYDRLWDLLEANPRWVAMVKPGNRVRYDGDGYQAVRHPHRAPADLAEAQIVPAPGGVIKLFDTGSSSAVDQNYTIRLRSGSLKVDRRLFPLKWEIVRAFAASDKTLGLPDWVTDSRIIDTYEDPIGPEGGAIEQSSGGGEGWMSLYTIKVSFRFNTRELATGAFA